MRNVPPNNAIEPTKKTAARFLPAAHRDRWAARSLTAPVSSENTRLVQDLVAAIDNRPRDRLRPLLRPNVRRHSTAAGEQGVRSAEDPVVFPVEACTTFPDAREEILDMVAEGDSVAVRHDFRETPLGPLGPFPPSGRTMSAADLSINRIEDGRIVEAWPEWDNRSGLKQLGHTAA